MSQLTEYAEWDHGLADNFSAEISQFVNRAAKPAQLLFENFRRKRMLGRRSEYLGRFQFATRAVGRLSGNSQLPSDSGVHE